MGIRHLGVSLLAGALLLPFAEAGQFDPPVGIQDEGGAETKPVFTLNCVGGGISCSQSGTTGTITVGGGGTTHEMLSATHSDSAANTVSRGSLIYGNSTPAWDELVVGAANTVLTANGTDASWSATPTLTTVTTTGTTTGTVLSATGALQVGADYISDITGSGLSVVGGQLTASGGSGTVTSISQGTNMSFSVNPITTTGTINLTASPSVTNITATSTATGTVVSATGALQVGSDYITDITGSGLSIVGGQLTASGGSNHNFLSATHTDTTAGSPTRGDLVVANSGASWAKFAVGGSNTVLTANGTDPAWSATPTVTNVTATGAATGTVVSATSALQVGSDYIQDITGNGLAITGGTLNADTSSTTVSGVVELAIASEVDTGTDATRAVTPDALAGSTIFGARVVSLTPFAPTANTAVINGAAYFRIPPELNGMNLIGIHTQVVTAGTTNLTSVQIQRCAAVTAGNACSGTVTAMLTTVCSIDSTEDSSDTAATPAVIDTANDDVATNQVLRVDVTAVQTTVAQGLQVELEFQLP